MVKSIQYFNEECVTEFEKLEDEFIKNPVDIAEYVTNLTRILHQVGVKMIEETLGYLMFFSPNCKHASISASYI